MSTQGKDYLGPERRKYIRLDSVFPVEFRLLSFDEKNFLSDWFLGFTNNISKGGICIEVSNLPFGVIQTLKSRQTKIYLNIKMPFAINPVTAKASLAWMKDIVDQTNRYLMGLNYEQIDAPQNNRIMRYARMKKLFIPVVLSIIIILGLGFMINSFINVKLIRGNKTLVEQLVKILQESSVAKQKIKQISRQGQDLQLKIEVLKARIQTTEEERMRLTERTKSKGARNTARLERLNTTIDKLIQEKSSLQEELIALQHKENNVTKELLLLDKKKVNLEKANLDKMYQWLKARQNPRTGLVVSFEGDKDIDNRAFTYDQALAMQVYNYFGDFQRTRKILDFFL